MSNAIIYTKPNCPFCDRAKAIFKKREITYEEVSAVENREVLIERVTKETGAAPKTVPQIWLDGDYIGGHDNLVAHFAKIDAEPAE